MFRAVLFLFAFTMTTQVARVEAQDSAAELFWNCTGTGAKNEVEAAAKSLMCLSYISGSFDMLRMMNDVLNLKAVCVPDDGLSNDQLIRVIVKWIESHPERMHETARSAVLSAMTEAFPCKKVRGSGGVGPTHR